MTGDFVNTIDVAGARGLIDNPPSGLVVLDIRTPEEWREGRLPGATMLDFFADDFVEQLGDLNRHVPYLVYCRSGGRSAKAAEFMDQIGFTNVTDFAGGWLDWSASGLPIEH